MIMKSPNIVAAYLKIIFVTVLAVFILAACDKDENDDPPQNNHQNGDPDPNGFDNECYFIEYYYDDGQQIVLGEMSGDFILLGSKIHNPDNDLEAFINALDYFDHDYEFEIMYGPTCSYKRVLVKLRETLDCIEVSELMYELRKFEIIDYIHFAINTEDCQDAFGYENEDDICVATYTNIFSVQVMDTLDLTDLQNLIIETNTVLIGQNQFMRDWFILKSDKTSKGSTLYIANYFYESEKFLESRPEIIKYVVE